MFLQFGVCDRLVKYLGENTHAGLSFSRSLSWNFPKLVLRIPLSLLSLCVTFPVLLREQSPLIHYMMNLCSSLVCMALGREISFSISRHNDISLMQLAMSFVASTTKPSIISLSMIIYTSMGLTPYYDDVSLMMKLRSFK